MTTKRNESNVRIIEKDEGSLVIPSLSQNISTTVQNEATDIQKDHIHVSTRLEPISYQKQAQILPPLPNHKRAKKSAFTYLNTPSSHPATLALSLPVNSPPPTPKNIQRPKRNLSVPEHSNPTIVLEGPTSPPLTKPIPNTQPLHINNQPMKKQRQPRAIRPAITDSSYEVDDQFWMKTFEVISPEYPPLATKQLNIEPSPSQGSNSHFLSPIWSESQKTWIFPPILLGRNGRVCRRNGLLHGCTHALKNFDLSQSTSPITINASPIMSRSMKFSDEPILIPRHCCTLQEITTSPCQSESSSALSSMNGFNSISTIDTTAIPSCSSSINSDQLSTRTNLSKPAYVLLWRYRLRPNIHLAHENAWVVIDAQFFPVKWFGSDFEKKHPFTYSLKINILDQIRTVRTFEDAAVAAWCLAGNLELTLKELGFDYSVKEIKEGTWKGFPEATLNDATQPVHDYIHQVTINNHISIIDFFEEIS